jgi:hypothetical protein
LITICSVAAADATALEKAREVVGTDRFVAVESASLPSDSSDAAETICRLLEAGGFIPELGDLTGGAGI